MPPVSPPAAAPVGAPPADQGDDPQDPTIACPKCGEQFPLSEGIKAQIAAEKGGEMGQADDASGGSDGMGGGDGGAYGDAEPSGFSFSK